MDKTGLYIMGSMYLLAGILHFIKPKVYLKIMPPYLPKPLFLVYLSGFFEAIFGLMLFFPFIQSIGAWGIIATLIGVFPANVYMLQAYKGKKHWYRAALWLRLPMQLGLIYWAFLYT